MRDTDVAGQQPAHVEAIMALNDVWLLNVLRVSVPGSRQFKREIWILNIGSLNLFIITGHK